VPAAMPNTKASIRRHAARESERHGGDEAVARADRAARLHGKRRKPPDSRAVDQDCAVASQCYGEQLEGRIVEEAPGGVMQRLLVRQLASHKLLEFSPRLGLAK
jgi:hypothetical protein